LAGIDGLANVPTSKQNLQKQIKAEALALRGLAYFDIARVYGYEPTKIPTTGTNAGFNKSAVLRLLPTKLASGADMKPRSTVTEVYTQIEKDFLASITTFQSLPAAVPTHPFKINQSAAHALLGRVYLYWGGKDAQAVTQFDLALAPAIAFAKLSTAANIVGDWKKIPHPESLFELNYVQSVEVTGVTGSNDGLFTYTQPTGRNASNVATFGGQTVSAELLALFDATDVRKNLIFNSNTSTTGTAYNWSNKYSAVGGAYTDNVRVLRYSDVLLMKAEALANQTLYTDAALLVTQLRTNRGASVVGVPVTAAIVDYIQDERRRELNFEGQRWFDLKRTGRAISKPAATAFSGLLYTDYRLLAPIPTGEISLNPALPQNPNY